MQEEKELLRYGGHWTHSHIPKYQRITGKIHNPQSVLKVPEEETSFKEDIDIGGRSYKWLLADEQEMKEALQS
ncbi:hypothetical protein Tco_0966937 [Tanacetum coccineum]